MARVKDIGAKTKRRDPKPPDDITKAIREAAARLHELARPAQSPPQRDEEHSWLTD